MHSRLNVERIFLTSEVATLLEYDSAYIIRVVKKLIEDGVLTTQDVRAAGKRNYIFNEFAIQTLKRQFNIED